MAKRAEEKAIVNPVQAKRGRGNREKVGKRIRGKNRIEAEDQGTVAGSDADVFDSAVNVFKCGMGR